MCNNYAHLIIYKLIICLLGTYGYLLGFSLLLFFYVWKFILLNNYMVFMKKIFSHVLFLSMKTFSHVIISMVTKNTTKHKNMAYMIIWLKMVISYICHGHRCQILVWCECVHIVMQICFYNKCGIVLQEFNPHLPWQFFIRYWSLSVFSNVRQNFTHFHQPSHLKHRYCMIFYVSRSSNIKTTWHEALLYPLWVQIYGNYWYFMKISHILWVFWKYGTPL